MRDSARREISVPAIRGRPFLRGNPGRKVGSQNRVTRIASALLTDEADVLVRKAVELAKGGDVGMLRFLLSRILPRERPINLELTDLKFASDAVEATATIIREVAAGKISPSEGAALTIVLKAHRDAIELAELVERIDRLEAKAEGRDE